MTKREIWVAGEALIDLVPDISGARSAIVGGGPANTAKALARLGANTLFIGGISRDGFGKLIAAQLEESGVDLSKSLISSLPSATATVSLGATKDAVYEFKLADTATFSFDKNWLPLGEPLLLVAGSLSSLIEPGASMLLEWAKGLKVPILFDPNVRPSVLGDMVSYRNSVEKWLKISTIVKLSEDDMNWMYGHEDPQHVLDFGPNLVVLTRGKNGILGTTRDKSIQVQAERVQVADTVGAGDTVGAVIAEAVAKGGLETTINNLHSVLIKAAKAAGITCSRAGANPPWKHEL